MPRARARRSRRPVRRRPSIWLESAQSPHCIAREVATVRYSVDDKPAVTCDNAQIPWSDDGRYLLCKQGVVGSSPIVSTAKVLAEAIFQSVQCTDGWLRVHIESTWVEPWQSVLREPLPGL